MSYVAVSGRAHDAHVYRNSPLFNELANHLYCGPVALEDSYHILGDQAYPVSKELLTPYKEPRDGRGLTADQRRFNKHLSSKRQVWILIASYYTLNRLVCAVLH